MQRYHQLVKKLENLNTICRHPSEAGSENDFNFLLEDIRAELPAASKALDAPELIHYLNMLPDFHKGELKWHFSQNLYRFDYNVMAQWRGWGAIILFFITMYYQIRFRTGRKIGFIAAFALESKSIIESRTN